MSILFPMIIGILCLVLMFIYFTFLLLLFRYAAECYGCLQNESTSFPKFKQFIKEDLIFIGLLDLIAWSFLMFAVHLLATLFGLLIIYLF